MCIVWRGELCICDYDDSDEKEREREEKRFKLEILNDDRKFSLQTMVEFLLTQLYFSAMWWFVGVLVLVETESIE